MVSRLSEAMPFSKDMELYLSGKQLYGNDLVVSDIERWYEEEGEGYANLGALDKFNYRYVYHSLNWLHGYSKVNLKPDLEILGFGSAYGEELIPILNKARNITIIDPSDAFAKESIGNVPCSYIKPNITGTLNFGDNLFDLVTVLGVLHHVPNVSAVMKELSRVMKPGAKMLLREPIVSMGDWRYPRQGLTQNERGIPMEILKAIISEVGLTIHHEALCVFPPMTKLLQKIGIEVYNNIFLTALDSLMSKLFRWNLSYHAIKPWKKIRPTSVFFVLEKL